MDGITSPIKADPEWAKPPLTVCRRCVKPAPSTPLWNRHGTTRVTPATAVSGRNAGFEAANYWLPVDIYIGGVNMPSCTCSTASASSIKLMRDAGMVTSDEPAKKSGCCVRAWYWQCVLLCRRNGERNWVSPVDAIVERDEKAASSSKEDAAGHELVCTGMVKCQSRKIAVDPQVMVGTLWRCRTRYACL